MTKRCLNFEVLLRCLDSHTLTKQITCASAKYYLKTSTFSVDEFKMNTNHHTSKDTGWLADLNIEQRIPAVGRRRVRTVHSVLVSVSAGRHHVRIVCSVSHRSGLTKQTERKPPEKHEIFPTRRWNDSVLAGKSTKSGKGGGGRREEGGAALTRALTSIYMLTRSPVENTPVERRDISTAVKSHKLSNAGARHLST